MSVRRNTKNRLTLIRSCGTCGSTFTTTADTPWLRSVPRDGKAQVNTYYCSATCYAASYKYKSCYDGKAAERRKARESARDISAKNRKNYEKHAEERRAYARARYWADPEAGKAACAYQRRKRKMLDAAQMKAGG